MFDWALGFFLVAAIAAVFGFGVIASSSAGIAKILFVIFGVLFVLSLILGLMGNSRPRIYMRDEVGTTRSAQVFGLLRLLASRGVEGTM